MHSYSYLRNANSLFFFFLKKHSYTCTEAIENHKPLFLWEWMAITQQCCPHNYTPFSPSVFQPSISICVIGAAAEPPWWFRWEQFEKDWMGERTKQFFCRSLPCDRRVSVYIWLAAFPRRSRGGVSMGDVGIHGSGTRFVVSLRNHGDNQTLTETHTGDVCWSTVATGSFSVGIYFSFHIYFVWGCDINAP